MDAARQPAGAERSVLGRSIGRIVDGALVVETTGFVATPWGIGDGLDSSEQKHLVEEYRLKEDGHVLEITYTVTDPVYLSAPYTRSHVKRFVPDYEMTPYEECDPDAAGMHLKLEGN